jgi:hypothetical protein
MHIYIYRSNANACYACVQFNPKVLMYTVEIIFLIIFVRFIYIFFSSWFIYTYIVQTLRFHGCLERQPKLQFLSALSRINLTILLIKSGLVQTSGQKNILKNSFSMWEKYFYWNFSNLDLKKRNKRKKQFKLRLKNLTSTKHEFEFFTVLYINHK